MSYMESGNSACNRHFNFLKASVICFAVYAISILSWSMPCKAGDYSQIEVGTFKFMRTPTGSQECTAYIKHFNIAFSTKNYKEGVTLLLKYETNGCDLGSQDGQILYNLGIIYDEGLEVAKSSSKAVELFEQSVEKGSMAAIYALGYFYKYDATPS